MSSIINGERRTFLARSLPPNISKLGSWVPGYQCSYLEFTELTEKGGGRGSLELTIATRLSKL